MRLSRTRRQARFPGYMACPAVPSPRRLADKDSEAPPPRFGGKPKVKCCPRIERLPLNVTVTPSRWRGHRPRVFERCGANTCAGRKENPVLEFDPSGKLLASFGAGMFVFPHGIFVDKDNNVWVADADGKDGIGHTVVKFSPAGNVLMTLGKQGVAGDGPDTFNRPSGVVVAPDGDIFVSDGHGGDSNARIMRFSKDGEFIKAWGRKGKGPGEFDTLHGIALDSKGRVFVVDRGNNRIQIFDRDGSFLDQWTQFSSPSGIFIDSKDVIYVADDTSNAKTRPEWPRAIRIGSAKDGSVVALIPETGAEDIVADANGNVYAAEVTGKTIKKFVKQQAQLRR
jgi:DNA-binding beta-propeller fold protein YncE